MVKADERGSVDWVVDQAAGFLDVKPADIKTASPHAQYRESRRIAAYVAWEVSESSAVEIGRVLGADHSYVIYAREKIKAQMVADQKFRDRVAKLLEDLRIALF